jgi:hypothetical protein
VNQFLKSVVRVYIARVKSDPAAMVAGWREVARLCGFYAPERKRVELSAAACMQRQRIADMSDEGLAELIVADAETEVELAPENWTGR